MVLQRIGNTFQIGAHSTASRPKKDYTGVVNKMVWRKG